MLKLLLTFVPIFFQVHKVNAQDCDISIEILPEKYMYGVAYKTDKTVENKEVEVDFGKKIMAINVPLRGENYRIEVLNENCRGYCKKQKRIRQLHSGDEQLVINLINQRKEDIINQIKGCSL